MKKGRKKTFHNNIKTTFLSMLNKTFSNHKSLIDSSFQEK